MAEKGPREAGREYVVSSQIKVAQTDGIDERRCICVILTADCTDLTDTELKGESRKSEVGGQEGQIFFVSFAIFARDLILSREDDFALRTLRTPRGRGKAELLIILGF